jgi:hypothetical protein
VFESIRRLRTQHQSSSGSAHKGKFDESDDARQSGAIAEPGGKSHEEGDNGSQVAIASGGGFELAQLYDWLLDAHHARVLSLPHKDTSQSAAVRSIASAGWSLYCLLR